MVELTDDAAIASLRQHFPALQTKAYFNFGGQGVLPDVARDELLAAYSHLETCGPFSRAANDWILERLQAARGAIASHLGTQPERVMLTESTTHGMNVPLWGLDWQPGDRVLLSDAEHYGVWNIVKQLQARFGIEADTCALMRADDPVETLERHLTPRTRMVSICHVLWNSGRVMPLADLARCCRDRGVLLHSDAAQSAGVMPLDVEALGVDFYAFAGHKWFCGPAGVGALYLSERGQEFVQPTYSGWRYTYAPENSAEQFEVATLAYPLYLAWHAALTFHDRFAPVADRYARQVRQARELWQKLRSLPGVTCL
ncbi:MAG: aminotransferase class V-fold PLP-dependent enzyme, partial [Cyanobacteria bacterium J06648_11]